MERDKLMTIIEDMRSNPTKYSQQQKDILFKGMQSESQRLAQAPRPQPAQVQPGLNPDESVQALRQFMASRYKNESEKQKEWDAERLKFGQAFKDMEMLGVPKEKLQPYLLQFLEKEYEMNRRANQIPLEQQELPAHLVEPMI